MNYEDAKAVVQRAIEYKAKNLGDGKAKDNVINAIKWMAIINDWKGREEAYIAVIPFAEEKYREWLDGEGRMESGLKLADGNDKGEVLARFVHKVAADIIAQHHEK